MERYRIYNPRGEDFIVEIEGEEVWAYIESEPYDARKAQKLEREDITS